MNAKRRLFDQRRALFGMLGLLVPACAADPDDHGGDAAAGMNAGGGGGAPEGGLRVPCESPAVLRTATGDDTGFEKCGDGRVHRSRPVTCAEPQPAGSACNLEDQPCKVDADCTERNFGRCIDQSSQIDACGCVYGCASDADCAAGTVCACGGADIDAVFPGGARCVPSGCSSDATCDEAELCVIGAGSDGCSTWYGMACTSPEDTCLSLADCGGDLYRGCFPDERGHFACGDNGVCGRPFVVAGAGRLSEPCFDTAWAVRGPAPSPVTLTFDEGAALTAHWLGMAALEHASVASFAQFTLGLIAHGAPPELLAASAQAMADEVDHARRCYAIASAFAGTPIAPGPLATSGARPAETLHDLLTATLREACVGETLGAVEAAHMAVLATDPVMASTWTRIASDELRHAALGWQTLAWGLPKVPALTPAAVRATVLAALADVFAGIGPAPTRSPEADARLRSLGMLPAAERRALFLEAAEVLIGPCVEGMMRGAGDCPAA